MEDNLADRISDLPDFDKCQLLFVWRENFSKAPPLKLRKELMVPILAYRMQEKENGGLSHSARICLREIAKSIASEKRPQQEIPPASEKGILDTISSTFSASDMEFLMDSARSIIENERPAPDWGT